MTTAVRVLVVDDHPLFRAGLASVLAELPDIEVVGEAADGAAAIALVDEQRPNVVLMDLRMPIMNGLAATAQITAKHPGTAVVVLTMQEDDNSIFAAVRAGAVGYLLKEADGDDVHRTVLAAARGEAVFGTRVAAKVVGFFSGALTHGPTVAAFPSLTDREREVLTLVAQGLDNKAIAGRLFLADKTVRNRVSDVLAKIGAATRAEAVALARDAGLAPGEPDGQRR
jgi:DNA-binding NarL/FixJ family response regulator